MGLCPNLDLWEVVRSKKKLSICIYIWIICIQNLCGRMEEVVLGLLHKCDRKGRGRLSYFRRRCSMWLLMFPVWTSQCQKQLLQWLGSLSTTLYAGTSTSPRSYKWHTKPMRNAHWHKGELGWGIGQARLDHNLKFHLKAGGSASVGLLHSLARAEGRPSTILFTVIIDELDFPIILFCLPSISFHCYCSQSRKYLDLLFVMGSFCLFVFSIDFPLLFQVR